MSTAIIQFISFRSIPANAPFSSCHHPTLGSIQKLADTLHNGLKG